MLTSSATPKGLSALSGVAVKLGEVEPNGFFSKDLRPMSDFLSLSC